MTGSSAGGMGVNLWHQYLKDMVPHPERVYSISDSSIFYDPLISLYPEEQRLQRIKERHFSKSLQADNDDPNPFSYLVQLANAD